MQSATPTAAAALPSLANLPPVSKRIRPFLIWLAGFYTVWLAIIVVGDHWSTLREHWGIAAAMAAGSYVAGSTPMGGGTIGFPVLVLLFGEAATLGRDFSFAVQSIGMVSASIFILSMRRPLAGRILRWAMLGSVISTPLGAAFIAPYVNDLAIKLLFAIIWASFGIMHFIMIREVVNLYGFVLGTPAFDRSLGFIIGLIGGGLVASITGVGIDLLVYVVLVLLVRADIRIAIPTSIVLMAFTSLVGLGANLMLGRLNPEGHTISPEVYANWLAAAPVVAIGAPFGAMMVNLISRKYTLIFVSFLCVGQFIWTCINERVGLATLTFAVFCVIAFNVVFFLLRRWGMARAAGAATARVSPTLQSSSTGSSET